MIFSVPGHKHHRFVGGRCRIEGHGVSASGYQGPHARRNLSYSESQSTSLSLSVSNFFFFLVVYEIEGILVVLNFKIYGFHCLGIKFEKEIKINNNKKNRGAMQVS